MKTLLITTILLFGCANELRNRSRSVEEYGNHIIAITDSSLDTTKFLVQTMQGDTMIIEITEIQ